MFEATSAHITSNSTSLLQVLRWQFECLPNEIHMLKALQCALNLMRYIIFEEENMMYFQSLNWPQIRKLFVPQHFSFIEMLSLYCHLIHVLCHHGIIPLTSLSIFFMGFLRQNFAQL